MSDVSMCVFVHVCVCVCVCVCVRVRTPTAAAPPSHAPSCMSGICTTVTRRWHYELTRDVQARTCSVRAAVSVCNFMQRPLADVRRSAIASRASHSTAHSMRAHESSPYVAHSSLSVSGSLKSRSQLAAATAAATAL